VRSGLVASLLVVATTCGGGSPDGGSATVTLGGDRVTVASLVDAHAALCGAKASAASEPGAARTAFFDRAHDRLHTVARALGDVDRARAAELLEAKEKVESGLDRRATTLAGDIGRLADVYRSALGQLAVPAPPCEK